MTSRSVLPALRAAACAPDQEAPPPGGPDPSIDANALHDATFALTELGPRLVGSEGEADAQAVMTRLFGEAGLADVAAEPFVLDAWQPGTATLYAGGASGRTVLVEALSPSPAIEVTAPLRTTAEDFAGAVVLASSAEGSRAEAFLSASLGGAAALVRVTDDLDHDGGPLVEVGHTLDGSPLPAAAVDHGVGEWLRDHLGEEVTLRLAPHVVPGHTSSNLVARIPGEGGGGGRVWVVAHYDSWHVSECAFDNALGAAALTRLAARALASGPPEREIVFLATSAEEQGLQGAAAFAAAHEAEIGPADTVIVLDVLWSGEGAYISLGTDEGLRAMGVEALDGLEAGYGSDHLTFVTRGARSIWLGRWPDRHYHTVADTLDQLDFDEVERAVATNWRILVELAGLPE